MKKNVCNKELYAYLRTLNKELLAHGVPFSQRELILQKEKKQIRELGKRSYLMEYEIDLLDKEHGGPIVTLDGSWAHDFNAAEAPSQCRPKEVLSPPGYRLRGLLQKLFPKGINQAIFEQIFRDIYEEYFEALALEDEKEARWILWRGNITILVTAVKYAVTFFKLK